MKEVDGQFEYEKDSKRFHRFQVLTRFGIVGTIYVPKHLDPLPEVIHLTRKKGGEE